MLSRSPPLPASPSGFVVATELMEYTKSTRIKDMTVRELIQRAPEASAVIIPIGSLEILGQHGPLGLDDMVAEAIVDPIAEQTGCLSAPLIPYGDTLEFGSYPGTVHIPQTVLEEYLYAVANSLLIHSGFRAVVFLATHSLNCHAANSVCRRLTIEGKKVLLADWWAAVGSRSCGMLEDTATGRGHGSEMITSVALALCKELVRMEDALAETPAPALEKVNRWNGTPFKTYGCFRQYCKSGAWGNMSLATAERGRLLLQRGVEAVSQFIMETLAQ